MLRVKDINNGLLMRLATSVFKTPSFNSGTIMHISSFVDGKMLQLSKCRQLLVSYTGQLWLTRLSDSTPNTAFRFYTVCCNADLHKQ